MQGSIDCKFPSITDDGEGKEDDGDDDNDDDSNDDDDERIEVGSIDDSVVIWDWELKSEIAFGMEFWPDELELAEAFDDDEPISLIKFKLSTVITELDPLKMRPELDSVDSFELSFELSTDSIDDSVDDSTVDPLDELIPTPDDEPTWMLLVTSELELADAEKVSIDGPEDEVNVDDCVVTDDCAAAVVTSDSEPLVTAFDEDGVAEDAVVVPLVEVTTVVGNDVNCVEELVTGVLASVIA
jgi:hypothetical protein